MKELALLIVLITSCSSLPLAQGKKTTPAPERKELQLDIPKDGWEPIFFKSINARANISNLKTLRAGTLPENDLEVRIWHGFGLTALEGFVLKRAAGQWSAMHLEGIHPGLPQSEYQKILAAPKSGWELSWQRLEEAGISMLPDASLAA